MISHGSLEDRHIPPLRMLLANHLALCSQLCPLIHSAGYITAHTVSHKNRTSLVNIYIYPFNGLLSGTTQVSRYQKGKTNLDFTEARASEWQWHQLGHMQVCTSLQTDNHASTPPLSFFTGRMPFLPPNQQRQSTSQ